MNPTEFVNVSNAAMDFVVTICTASFDEILAHAQPRSQHRRSANSRSASGC